VPYVSFAALGLDIAPEGIGNQGELGMAVKFNVRVYRFEFKAVEKKNAEIAEGRAPRQIKEKRHADKYRALEKPICLIGVEFSRKKRNVAAFEVKAPDQGLGIRACFYNSSPAVSQSRIKFQGFSFSRGRWIIEASRRVFDFPSATIESRNENEYSAGTIAGNGIAPFHF
jgi:hypothetical protein